MISILETTNKRIWKAADNIVKPYLDSRPKNPLYPITPSPEVTTIIARRNMLLDKNSKRKKK